MTIADLLIPELERVARLPVGLLRTRLREIVAMLEAARRRFPPEPSPPAAPRPVMKRAERTFCGVPWMIYPLRRGVDIAIEGLPHDLTRRDLRRIKAWLDTLVWEEDEAPAPAPPQLEASAGGTAPRGQ